MRAALITLTTDFGTRDTYVAQMKGVILGINPQVRLVDVTHDVPPQDVPHAARLLEEIVHAFPAGTIHVAVVDPGVGTERRIVGVEAAGQRFIAPDNGLLTHVLRGHAPGRVVELTNSRYWRQQVSRTFHGRDIMAPVAAHWSLGVDLGEFGPAVSDPLVLLPERLPECRRDVVRGEVVAVDVFGNLATNITVADVPDAWRDQAQVELQNTNVGPIRACYADVPAGSVLATIDSQGRVEIAVNGGSAARLLEVGVGVPVRVVPGSVKQAPTDR